MSSQKRRPFVEQLVIAAAVPLAEHLGQEVRGWLRRRREAHAAAEQAAREAAQPKRKR